MAHFHSMSSHAFCDMLTMQSIDIFGCVKGKFLWIKKMCILREAVFPSLPCLFFNIQVIYFFQWIAKVKVDDVCCFYQLFYLSTFGKESIWLLISIYSHVKALGRFWWVDFLLFNESCPILLLRCRSNDLFSNIQCMSKWFAYTYFFTFNFNFIHSSVAFTH